MNGIPTHMPPNMSGPPRRSGNSPAGGLVPTITSSLRGVIMYNQTALTQAISQIEAIGDIQNELVNARSAHAQVSKDLQICMERHAAQSRLLLKTQDELRVTTQNLHGAREQLGLLESRLASVDGKEQVGQGVQQNKASNYFVYSDMATSAAIAAQHSDNPIAKVDVLPQSSSRVRALERRLAVVLGMSDQDLTMASDRLVETPTGPNARATPGEVDGQQRTQVLACFKALRSEFDAGNHIPREMPCLKQLSQLSRASTSVLHRPWLSLPPSTSVQRSIGNLRSEARQLTGILRWTSNAQRPQGQPGKIQVQPHRRNPSLQCDPPPSNPQTHPD
ncbi:hypothetical protein RSOL_444970 [Rhizoctonia solani AG-3 Rhs1AP]|uniref:Uncharacterized protein n=1 Tax=Rhizoctonia solani AG-3 Rhs1AP TaxID=1086054 RepID=X8JNH8_9AGAM|nr:hypothetical protein RSOL_444970 [Rhizoctonia solani AG-3 Rhs1AP]